MQLNSISYSLLTWTLRLTCSNIGLLSHCKIIGGGVVYSTFLHITNIFKRYMILTVRYRHILDSLKLVYTDQPTDRPTLPHIDLLSQLKTLSSSKSYLSVGFLACIWLKQICIIFLFESPEVCFES